MTPSSPQIRFWVVTSHPDQGGSREILLPAVPRVGQSLRLLGCDPGLEEWVIREVVFCEGGYVEIRL